MIDINALPWVTRVSVKQTCYRCGETFDTPRECPADLPMFYAEYPRQKCESREERRVTVEE